MNSKFQYPWLYVIAAKGIQDYILRGDRLRLMVGGSEIVDQLPNDFIDRIAGLQGWKMEDDCVVLSRAAGSARLLFHDEGVARHLALLMPPAISQFAPGLDFAQAVVQVHDGDLSAAMRESERLLAIRRNILFPSLPVAGPLVQRCQRSGLPVADMLRLYGSEKEAADIEMLAKDVARKQAKQGLVVKILPESARGDAGQPRRKLPDDFEELASEANSNIAIFHADGNGIGQLVIKLMAELATCPGDEVARVYKMFSAAIAMATERAVRDALAPIIEAADKAGAACYPFRPLICAGDDVTLVLRACDAMGFAERFLNAFERTSLEELNNVPPLKGQMLTACAGIAYVKKSFPFPQAYALCESLAAFAKNAVARSCSALAFWRLTAHVADDFESVLDKELKGADGTTLTAMPYVAGGASGASAYPRVQALDQLKAALAAMPRGSLRGLLTDMYRGKAVSDQAFDRIRKVAQGRGKTALACFTKLQESLHVITGVPQGMWSPKPKLTTPLHDAIELLAAEQGQRKSEETKA